MKKLVEQAVKIFKAQSAVAYSDYTDKMLIIIERYYPLNSDVYAAYEAEEKRVRAQLSQAVGAASKSAKGSIILAYAQKFSASKQLDFSLREAQQVMIHAAGRSVAKQQLSGLFDRDKSSSRFSPYFNDEAHRQKVHKHILVKNLTKAVELFDKEKPDVSNHRQAEINAAIKSKS